MVNEGRHQASDETQAGPQGDPAPPALALVQTCGSGPVLDVAAGRGRMVLELLRMGIDAWGCADSAATVTAGNDLAPGRFTQGQPLALPYPDERFETVYAAGCLEHLAPTDLPAALAELYRVTRRGALLQVAADGQPRAWWEELAFAAGFRRHPALLRLVPYDQMTPNGQAFTLLLEKIPAPALAAHSMAKLKAERDLHMDMLRETGRRSDAHLFRYELAARLVRPGDVVLDSACGLGYGSHLLASLTPAGRVLGLDLSDGAIEYADAMFATPDQRVSFRPGDVQDLAFLPDHSVDLVVSFETLEHIPEPATFLAEARRVLRPGGRIIASVPNRWDDGTGHDPSPYHFHLYHWQRLAEEAGRHFLLEQGYGQTAGGGMRLGDSAPEVFAFQPGTGPTRDCEWILVVGMVDPMQAQGIPYTEAMYPKAEQPGPLIAFEGDYRNPFLAHALVSLPWRLSQPGLLQDLAQRVEASSGLDTPDHGAALCVQAYGLLKGWPSAAALLDLRTRIVAFLAQPPRTPHLFRWQISLSYVSGLAALQMGDRHGALAAFRQCAGFDCRSFSPTLVTKTASAAYQAGRLLSSMGRTGEAQQELERGISRFFEIFEGGRAAMLGTGQRPFDAPYFELTEAAAALTNCVNLLRELTGRGATTALLPLENLQGVISRLQTDSAQLRSDRDAWRQAAEAAQTFIRNEAGQKTSLAAARLAIAFVRALNPGLATVVFGCGPLGRDLARVLRAEQVPILGFCDNNETLWNTHLDGLPVLAPAAVFTPDFQGQVIFASSLHSQAMAAELFRRCPWIRPERCLIPTRAQET